MLEEEKKLKEEEENKLDLKNIDESAIGKMSASFTKKNKISNDKFMNEIIKNNTFSDKLVNKGATNDLAQVAADTVVVERKSELPKKMTKGITIFVNNEPVKLSGKSDYILVDLFQFYEFDLSKPKGVVVLKQNGNKGEYTAPLKEGDKIDLYWEDLTQ